MEEEVPVTLEYLESQLAYFKEEDLKKKLDIAANVLKKCEQVQFVDLKCHLTKANLLTGVPRNTLEVISFMEQKCKKFDDWIRDERRKIHGYHFAYRNLRNLLVNNYTTQFKIPTNLQNDQTAHKQFCISLQIPGTKKSMIVEKPETFMARHRFLHTKMLHRAADRNIVYIGKINLLSNKGRFSYKEDIIESNNRFLIAASPTLGYLSYLYFTGSSQEYLMNWIKDQIEPELPKESVIIFQENLLRAQDTNIHFSKEEMIKWLESKEIPHDPKVHRAELFKLIKRYNASDKGDFAGVETVLMAQGHMTMRKKKCNLVNNYFDPFWAFLIHELNSKSLQHNPRLCSSSDLVRRTANLIVQNAPIDYWKRLDDILIEKERQIYKEDIEMEYVIDQLMTMAKDEGLPNDEGQKLDKYSKQLSDEHFFLSVSLIEFIRQLKIVEERASNKTSLGN